MLRYASRDSQGHRRAALLQSEDWVIPAMQTKVDAEAPRRVWTEPRFIFSIKLQHHIPDILFAPVL